MRLELPPPPAGRRSFAVLLGVALVTPFALAVNEELRAMGPASEESPEPDPVEVAVDPVMPDGFYAVFGTAPALVVPAALADYPDVMVRAGERYAADAALDAGVFLVFPDGGRAERELTRRWGRSHQAVDDRGVARAFWFEPESEIRAVLETADGRARLELRRYRRFDRLVAELRDELVAAAPVGSPPGPAVGESKPNAAEPAEPAAPPADPAAREYLDTSYSPAEMSDAVTEVRRWRTGGRLDAIELEVDFIYDPSFADRAVAELVAAYGEPERDPGGRLIFGGVPRMIVVVDRAIQRLSVELRGSS